MSHSNNQSDKSFRVHYQEYLRHINEPEETYGASTELDANLIRSSYHQKRRLRGAARRLRNAI